MTEAELRILLVGRTIRDVKVDERTGTRHAYLKLSAKPDGQKEAIVSADANFADASSVWERLP